MRTSSKRRAWRSLSVAEWLAGGALLIAGWLLAGCGSSGAGSSDSPASDRIYVVATTGIVADLVQRVGGERVEVDALMGPGVDPHLYKATASDVIKLSRATLIFYNGLLLEGKMTEVLASMRQRGKPTVPLADSLPRERLIQPEQLQGHFDPHIWFDVSLWAETIPAVVAGLAEVDPEHRAEYESRAALVRRELEELHFWGLRKAEELPPSRRILVTSHDAYGYFGRAYGFDVIGLQGISTVTEAGLADMARLVDYIREKAIKAIFVESSVPHATIERIAADAQVAVGGELFSDAMGTPGQIENGYDLGTYEGMVKHNFNTIVEGLR